MPAARRHSLLVGVAPLLAACAAPDPTVTTLPDLPEPHHNHGTGVVDAVASVLLALDGLGR